MREGIAGIVTGMKYSLKQKIRQVLKLLEYHRVLILLLMALVCLLIFLLIPHNTP